MFYKPCPYCQDCFIEEENQAPTTEGTLGLLLPLGTITLNSVVSESSEDFCRDTRLEDGWHNIEDLAVLQNWVSPDQHAMLRNLDFLRANTFIALSFARPAADRSTLIVRVYIIPYDWPGVGGILRNRDEITVVGPARKAMKQIFLVLNQCYDRWCGRMGSEVQKVFSDYTDPRTMAEIYTDLPSPQVAPHSESSIIDVLKDIKNRLPIPGLQSSLYPYQRISVAVMLQKEAGIAVSPDPLYLQLDGIDGRHFYYQPTTMEILQEEPLTDQNRGGILCEELGPILLPSWQIFAEDIQGTGKTVMILALVLATLDEIPSPEDPLSETKIWTSRSYRHSHPVKATSRDNQEFPTLAEIAMDCIRKSPSKAKFRRGENELVRRGLWGPLMENHLFYLERGNNKANSWRALEKCTTVAKSRKTAKDFKLRPMYLSSATLIVVPPNLLGQWQSEILKHCLSDQRHSLRVIVADKGQLPAPREFASKYDIVLMTYPKFSAEASLNDVARLHTGYRCRCPLFDRAHIPNCKCQGVAGVSSLLQVHWKRLVFDEGQNTATTTTSLTHFAKLLSVERRWIVTGTPTANLLGLSLGSQKESTIDNDSPDENEELPEEGQPDSPTPSQTNPNSPTQPKRIWTTVDRNDLNKLKTMMVHFLQVPQFVANQSLFKTHVVAPLLDPQGPQPGAIQVLTQVLSNIMIRHLAEDVAKHAKLLPIEQTAILLDLDHYGLRTYNTLLAGFAANAVDSMREGKDYLLDPRNGATLARTMENMSQSLFWHFDADHFNHNLGELFERAKTALINATSRNQAPEDILLVKKAMHHLREAAADTAWRSMHNALEIPYRLYGLPQELRHAWEATPAGARDGVLENPFLVLDTPFLYPRRIMSLRDVVVRRPLCSVAQLVDHAVVVRHEEDVRDTMILARELRKKKTKGQGLANGDRDAHAKKIRNASGTVDLEELRREYQAAQNGLKTALIANVQQHVDYSDLLTKSPLAPVRIGNSTSTKLDFILKEVLLYGATEKFLIFSQSPLTLAHIGEGLMLVGVNHLSFDMDATPILRQQRVTTFETSDTYRVLLMELRHGARGLNLVSASRVLFCEPVWQPDVESQAIKRVHRIGQTRPVTVKTLGIRSTFEEEMIKRRESFKKGSSEKLLPDMISDSGIRRAIEHPTFLVASQATRVELDVPLLPLPRKVSESDAHVEATERTPSKRRRVTIRVPSS